MTDDDVELAQLLAPSTFSLDECRARSRKARTTEQLKFILRGEKRVMEARTKRVECPRPAAEPSSLPPQPVKAAASAPHGPCTWTAEEKAKIQKGKEAAERMRASADMRRDLRKSWARSSSASAAPLAAAGWCSKGLANDCISVGANKQSQPRLDLTSPKSFNERYSMNSARSMASSVDASVPF